MRSSSKAVAQTRVRRLCPFCDAPFTDRMQAWMGESEGCACCGGARAGHWPIKAPVRDTPELACEACGKVLYRAP
jgi:hypothetical protein